MSQYFVSVPTVANRWGRSASFVRKLINSGRLEAIDVSEPESQRPCWSISMASVRNFESKCRRSHKRRQANASGITRNAVEAFLSE